MISVVWEHRGWPISWEQLNKKGNSNFKEQKQAFGTVFPLFKDYSVVVLGDREFCSVRLGRWLKRKKVDFCLRLKSNEHIETETNLYTQFSQLGLRPGMQFYFEGVRVNKQKGFGSFNIAAKWQRKLKGDSPKEPWYILTSLGDLPSAIEACKKRFSIEEMFRDFKAGGYDLEKTNVEGQHLSALVLLIAIAYTTAALKGQNIKHKGVQKYVGRVVPRHSHFSSDFMGKPGCNL